MKSTFGRLLKLASPIKQWMLLAALLGSITVLSGVGLMATAAYLISAAALHPSVAALGIAMVGVRFFGIARGVFRYLERLVSHRATFRLLTNLRTWFYAALEPLMPARVQAFQHGRMLRSGDLLRCVVADIDTLQNFYIRIIAPPVVAVIVGGVMWFFLGAFGSVFALTFLVFFLLSSVGVPLMAHLLSNNVGQRMVTTRAELHTQLVDSIQGIADLVAFGQEEQQSRRIEELNRRLNVLQILMAHISGLQGALSNLLMNMTMWTMLLVAIPLVRAGQLHGLLLALLVLATLASFEIVLPLPAAFQQMGASLAAARRLFEIVDAQPAVTNPVSPSPVVQDYTVSVQQLHFRYAPAEAYVLKDINLTLSQGQCIVIVGPSGSGKSTLAQLLLRFRDYEEGHILLGGHELQSYRQEDLYQLVSVVEQDTHLFNTTIRENLLLARPGAADAEIVQAATQAQLDAFVRTLPAGYDTQVGEQGLRLSGGERQRVALARAFLKDAPLLILDEPTVNLDAISERTVLQALRKLCQGRTTLMITHRLVELDMADEILVMQAGYIVERGKQYELLQAEGIYWHMWQQQCVTTIEMSGVEQRKVTTHVEYEPFA